MTEHVFDASCWCGPVVDGNVAKHNTDAAPPAPRDVAAT